MNVVFVPEEERYHIVKNNVVIGYAHDRVTHFTACLKKNAFKHDGEQIFSDYADMVHWAVNL